VGGPAEPTKALQVAKDNGSELFQEMLEKIVILRSLPGTRQGTPA
jgi:hypothetical protein